MGADDVGQRCRQDEGPGGQVGQPRPRRGRRDEPATADDDRAEQRRTGERRGDEGELAQLGAQLRQVGPGQHDGRTEPQGRCADQPRQQRAPRRAPRRRHRTPDREHRQRQQVGQRVQPGQHRAAQQRPRGDHLGAPLRVDEEDEPAEEQQHRQRLAVRRARGVQHRLRAREAEGDERCGARADQPTGEAGDSEQRERGEERVEAQQRAEPAEPPRRGEQQRQRGHELRHHRAAVGVVGGAARVDPRAEAAEHLGLRIDRQPTVVGEPLRGEGVGARVPSEHEVLRRGRCGQRAECDGHQGRCGQRPARAGQRPGTYPAEGGRGDREGSGDQRRRPGPVVTEQEQRQATREPAGDGEGGHDSEPAGRAAERAVAHAGPRRLRGWRPCCGRRASAGGRAAARRSGSPRPPCR